MWRTVGDMALEIVCPSCGTDDDLSGTPLDDDQIRLTCAACKIEWTRDRGRGAPSVVATTCTTGRR